MVKIKGCKVEIDGSQCCIKDEDYDSFVEFILNDCDTTFTSDSLLLSKIDGKLAVHYQGYYHDETEFMSEHDFKLLKEEVSNV